MPPNTSSGLNTYQLAGLIGTASSQVMSSAANYTASTAGATATNYQAGMSEAAAGMAASQMGIDAALQKIMREQEQADLTYQSQRQEIGADLVNAQKDMVQAEANAQHTELLRTLNKTDTNMVMTGVAQNRSGSATIENLRNQQRYRADQEIELINSVLKGKNAELNTSQADLLAQSKIASLSAESSASRSIYEQESAKIGAEYTKKSAAVTAKLAKSNAARAMKSANINLGLSVLSAAGSMYGGIATRTPTTTTKVS